MKAHRRSTRRLLAAIQRHLTAIYRIDAPVRAQDFLLDARGRARLARSADVPEADGQLLVLEEPDVLWLGLYLDERVQDLLGARDPYRRLDHGNLSPFLTAVEETSHFLYLIWSFRHGRAVTRLELELQAEVDKFAAGALVIAGQRGDGGGLDTASLARILFRAWSLEEGLDPEDASRYCTASRLAARYCGALQARYLPARGPSRIDPLLGDLRRFYRQGGAAKIGYIARN